MKGSIIPYVVVAVFILFGVFMGQFVYRSMGHDVNLVTKDYYQQELAFQQKIDQRKASTTANESIEISAEDGILKLDFGELNITGGELHLFRHDDANLDKIIAVSNQQVQRYKTDQFKEGLWKVAIEYELNGQSLLKEKTVYFN